MTAMPLTEYAKGADELTRGITDIFVEESDIIGAMMFESVSGGVYRYDLEATLPGIAFRGLNESYTPDFSIENPQVEITMIAGGEADVDIATLRRHGEARRTRETNRKIKKWARVWTDKFINGDHTSSPREFDGLKNRIVTGSQLIHNSGASGGAALSLLKLDELIAKVRGPNKVLIMAPAMKRRFTALIRDTSVSGYIMETRGSLGSPMITYNNIPFLCGFGEDGPDTGPIAFDEVGNGGGSAVTSSIYCCSLREDGLFGIQDGAMHVKDFDELESKPAKRVRVEWDAGIVIEDPYSVARLTSITDAAIAA